MSDWNPDWLSELDFDSDPWEWQTTCKILDDCFDVPGCLWSDEKVSENASIVCDDPVTPAQGSAEVSHLDDESEDVEIVDDIPEEQSSRFKRRKLLHFKSDAAPSLGSMPVAGVRSQKVGYPVEEELSADWNLQCPEGASVAGCESLDQPSEAWISSLIGDQDDVLICSDEKLTPVQIVDEDVQIVDEDVQIVDEDVQIVDVDVQIVDEVQICSSEKYVSCSEIVDEHVQIVDEGQICSNEKYVSCSEIWTSSQTVDEVQICSNEKFPPVQFKTTSAGNATNRSGRKHAVRSSKIPLKGKKPIMNIPASTRSFIAYPFTFLKPSAIAGDVTLDDINRRLLCPPLSALKQKYEEHDALYPTSAFSGKPVVGATTIRTEGGKGAITILRTKG